MVGGIIPGGVTAAVWNNCSALGLGNMFSRPLGLLLIGATIFLLVVSSSKSLKSLREGIDIRTGFFFGGGGGFSTATAFFRRNSSSSSVTLWPVVVVVLGVGRAKERCVGIVLKITVFYLYSSRRSEILQNSLFG